MQRIEGWVELGNRTITVSGIVSSANTPVQRSYPVSTITVYLTGTLTLAAIYSDNASTAKANPFTSDATGFYFFYIADGAYDVKLSGGTLPAPFTLGPDSAFDQNANWINVKASPYLAKGDGSTDDTAAITAAINAAGSPPFTIFFPPGVYIVSQNGSDYIIPQPSDVWIRGAGMGVSILKVKANSGSYKSFFGPYGTVVNNFTLTDLTIDQNSLNNPIPSQGDLNSHFRDIISPTTGGGHMTIDHVEFTNLDGFNTIYYGTPYTNITNCYLTNIGGSSFDHDYSAIYNSGDHATIANNVISGRALGANGAHAALETHGSDVTVSNNSIANLLIGFHITSQEPSEATALTITGNVFNGVFDGIFLWSMQYGGHTTGYGLHGVIVANNVVRINQSAYFIANPAINNSPSGIILWPLSNLPAKDILISNNIVEYDLETIAPPSTLNLAGFGLGYWDALTTNSATQITISDNRVLNAPGIAIRYDADGSDVLITGNAVTNPGSSPGSVNAFSRVGIFLAARNSLPLTNFVVTNNTIVDDQATTVMAFGVTISSPHNTAGGIVLSGNLISATGSNVSAMANTHAIPSGVVYVNDLEYIPSSSGTLFPSGVQINESGMIDTFRGTKYRYQTGTGWALFWNNAPLTGLTQAVSIHATGSVTADTAVQTPILSVRNPGSTGTLEYTGTDTPTHSRWKLTPQDAESSANAGSNMYLYRYADDGSFIAANMEWVRATGAVNTYGDLSLVSTGVARTLSIGGAANACTIRVGVGSPNSVLTGNPGDLYLNASGGASTSLYVKESGIGTNTGWVGK